MVQSGSPSGNRIANFFMDHDTDGGIDGIFFLFAASAEDDAGGADLLAEDFARRSLQKS